MRAVRAYGEHYREPVTVADVAAGVGLSVRQLQEVVRSRFGQTPMQMLRDVRLERARELLSSGIAPTVAAAAMDVGCLHLGRFAAAYRARFGESPSRRGRRLPSGVIAR
jgi:transcriptional regulator GlxA family with amidase domain